MASRYHFNLNSSMIYDYSSDALCVGPNSIHIFYMVRASRCCTGIGLLPLFSLTSNDPERRFLKHAAMVTYFWNLIDDCI